MGKFTLNDGTEIFVDDSSFMSFYQQQIQQQQQQQQQQVQQSQEAPLPTALSPRPIYNTPAQNIQDALYPQQESLPPGWRRSGTDFAPVYSYIPETGGGLVIAGGRPSTGIPNFQEARQQATQQEPLKIIGYDTLHDSLGRLVSMPVYERSDSPYRRPTVDQYGNPVPSVAQPSVSTAPAQPSVSLTSAAPARTLQITDDLRNRLEKAGVTIRVDENGNVSFTNRRTDPDSSSETSAQTPTPGTSASEAPTPAQTPVPAQRTPQTPAQTPAQTSDGSEIPLYALTVDDARRIRDARLSSEREDTLNRQNTRRNAISALRNNLYKRENYVPNRDDYSLTGRINVFVDGQRYSSLNFEEFSDYWKTMSDEEKDAYLDRLVAIKVSRAVNGGMRMQR